MSGDGLEVFPAPSVGGVAKVTASLPLASSGGATPNISLNAGLGAADQIFSMNDAATDGEWLTPGGDWSGPIDTNTVVSLTGAAGSTLAKSNLISDADGTRNVGTATVRFLAMSALTFAVFAASGDANPTWSASGSGTSFGVGGATAVDTRIARTAAHVLTLDDGAGGSATLRSPATLTINSVTANAIQVGGVTVLSLGAVAGDFLKLGATALLPATGGLRLANAIGVVTSNAAHSFDLPLITADGADNIIVGELTHSAAMYVRSFGSVNIQTSGGIAISFANSQQIQITYPTAFWLSAAVSPSLSQQNIATNSATGQNLSIHAQNATGTTAIGGDLLLSGGTGTTNYGQVVIQSCLNPGYATIAMADAPQTLSVANSAKNIVRVTGTNTAVRALTISRPPTVGTMLFIDNQTVGFGITVQFLTGAATATIPVGKDAIVYSPDGVNAFAMTITN